MLSGRVRVHASAGGDALFFFLWWKVKFQEAPDIFLSKKQEMEHNPMQLHLLFLLSCSMYTA